MIVHLVPGYRKNCESAHGINHLSFYFIFGTSLLLGKLRTREVHAHLCLSSCSKSFFWAGCSTAEVCHLEATSERRSLGMYPPGSMVELKAFPGQLLVTMLYWLLLLVSSYSAHRKLGPAS